MEQWEIQNEERKRRVDAFALETAESLERLGIDRVMRAIDLFLVETREILEEPDIEPESGPIVDQNLDAMALRMNTPRARAFEQWISDGFNAPGSWLRKMCDDWCSRQTVAKWAKQAADAIRKTPVMAKEDEFNETVYARVDKILHLIDSLAQPTEFPSTAVSEAFIADTERSRVPSILEKVLGKKGADAQSEKTTEEEKSVKKGSERSKVADVLDEIRAELHGDPGAKETPDKRLPLREAMEFIVELRRLIARFGSVARKKERGAITEAGADEEWEEMVRWTRAPSVFAQCHPEKENMVRRYL